MSRVIDKNKVDVAQAFLMYMLCVGDVERTALALELEPAQIRELAAAECWSDKLRSISVISKSGRPGDFERAQNRALCFVQAALIRKQVNRLLAQVSDMTEEELMARASVRTRDGGTQISAKFFVDMANAAEACHRMTYMSLGDTVTERQERDTGGPNGSSNDLHAAIIAHLSNPNEPISKPIQLLEEEATEEMRRIAPVDVTENAPAIRPEGQPLPTA